MLQHKHLNALRIPQVLLFSLMLALMLTFTACDAGDGAELDDERLEEGVGGEEADD